MSTELRPKLKSNYHRGNDPTKVKDFTQNQDMAASVVRIKLNLI